MVQTVGGDEAGGESVLQVRHQSVLVHVGQQADHTLRYEDDHQEYCILKYHKELKMEFPLMRRQGAKYGQFRS